jgi:very-short-patch-repair endonuclease
VHREAELARLGYRVFRIRNDEVCDNVEGILESLLAELEKDA